VKSTRSFLQIRRLLQSLEICQHFIERFDDLAGNATSVVNVAKELEILGREDVSGREKVSGAQQGLLTPFPPPGAAECLIAVKRWELLHQARKTNLSDLCRAAGLERVPIDAYSNGSPPRMTQVAGETVIYSAGPDGDDDGGLKDSDQGRNPDGDVLFRLPKPASTNRIGTDRR